MMFAILLVSVFIFKLTPCDHWQKPEIVDVMGLEVIKQTSSLSILCF